jgi:hypothetical protein
MQEIWVCHLGIVGYGEALSLQERIREARQAEELPDVLLTLEHPPVYTWGRRSVAGELPMGEDWYLARGIETLETDRGGRVTYHGPGQLVGYPIVRVDDVVAYVRTLENALVSDRGAPVHRRLGRGPEDRLDRGPPVAGREHARICGQRRERPAAVFVDRPVWAGRGADDVAGSRMGTRPPPDAERHEVLPPASCLRGRARAGAAAEAGFAVPFGDAGPSSLSSTGRSSCGRCLSCRHVVRMTVQPVAISL